MFEKLSEIKNVVLETPDHQTLESKAYSALCFLDCLSKSEAPVLANTFYHYETIFAGNYADQRETSSRAKASWIQRAGSLVVYSDLGITFGMSESIAFARHEGIFCTVRQLIDDGEPSEFKEGFVDRLKGFTDLSKGHRTPYRTPSKQQMDWARGWVYAERRIKESKTGS